MNKKLVKHGPNSPSYNPEVVLTQLRRLGVRRCEYIFFAVDEKIKACAFVFRIGKRRFGSQVILINTDLLTENQVRTFLASARKLISRAKCELLNG